MIWAILTSFCLSFAASTASTKPLLPFRLENIKREGRISSFDLNFGFLTIHQVQAFSEESFASVRMPASFLRSGRSEPEVDFLSEELKRSVWKALEDGKEGKKFKPSMPSLHVATLEQVKTRGSRLARGEIWIGGALTLKVSLMKSKWSDSPDQAWVAYPAQWLKDKKSYYELVEIRDKELKKRITSLIRQEYSRRYGGF